MDQSYQDGQAGLPMQDGGDRTAYNAGLAERHNAAYNESYAANQQSGEKSSGSAWAPPARSYPVDGVAFTILLLSPVLFMIYPILGFSLYGALGITILVGKFLPIHMAIVFLGGCGLGIAAFFWGIKMEAKMSGQKSYRVGRVVWRYVSICLSSGGAIGSASRSSGAAGPVAGGLVAASLVQLICSQLDKLYFSDYIPPPKAGTKEAIKLAKVTPIIIEGPITDPVCVSEGNWMKPGHWTFKIGGKPMYLKGEYEGKTGSSHIVAGLPGEPFEALAMYDQEMKWMHTAKYPDQWKWIAALFGCFLIAVKVYPLLGFLALYFPFKIFNDARKRRIALYHSRLAVEARQEELGEASSEEEPAFTPAPQN